MVVEQTEQGGGNKQPPLFIESKASFQSVCWVMTYNNYPNDIFEQIERHLVPLCSKYCFGKEVGDKGTPHIQGAFVLKKKMRQGTIYNLFKATFFLEKMKGKWSDQKYCAKDGKFITNVIFKPSKPKIKILSYDILNAWELKVDDICRNQSPDDRTIYWFWSKQGCVGKTTFCKYLHKTFECCIIGGKAIDSKNCIASFINQSEDKRSPDIVLCPIPKSMDTTFFSYEGVESIKDMFFYSGKYEGCQVNDNSPHLFVFGNEPPDESKCSADRWKIYEILDEHGNYVEHQPGCVLVNVK